MEKKRRSEGHLRSPISVFANAATLVLYFGSTIKLYNGVIVFLSRLIV